CFGASYGEMKRAFRRADCPKSTARACELESRFERGLGKSSLREFSIVLPQFSDLSGKLLDIRSREAKPLELLPGNDESGYPTQVDMLLQVSDDSKAVSGHAVGAD